MQIVSVNLSAQPRPHPNDPDRLTGVYKEPADALFAGPLGVLGDHVCDTTWHGDPAKALCVYCGQHYEQWRTAYPRVAWGPGCFGENLTVLGFSEESVHLGDVWEVGEALLQVSQPRQPCGTLSGRHGVPDLVKAAVDAGFTGWYVRVLRPGRVRPGDALRVVAEDPLGVSITQANQAIYDKSATSEQLAAVLAVGALSEAWRKSLGERWLAQETERT